ncbi:methyltransferase [Wielerella bovis]|uniref:methyltransferase n=1 Tax=Wielerella bovis TaxID=2917790 RepID=UPI0020198824|nr:methyltransferase [Wielerella bovis]ULJ63025.1 methyltransferase [Wielerella bovis]ULJ65256.1 methyltransferase [Wielerella bovis]ULJ67603.1 methyltransferase [Wielerella bovis]
MNAEHWLIHRHFAEHMDSRLLLLRQAPQHILLHGADGDISRSLLAARYPQATLIEFESRTDFATQTLAIRQENSGWWAKISGKTNWVKQGNLKTINDYLPEQSADMLWSNLLLPYHAHTADLLDNWAQALQPNGLLFFTCLGADSFPELRAVFQAASIAYSAKGLPEMHDLGDLLLAHGFYDPIVDTAKLVLSYEKLDTLLQDLASIGVWQALSLDDNPPQCAIMAAWEQGLLREMTLETVFGHALKKQVLPNNAQPVQFYPRQK